MFSPFPQPGNSLWVQAYDVMVTPPNHYTVGRLAETEKTVYKYEEGTSRMYVWLVKVKLVSFGYRGKQLNSHKAIRKESDIYIAERR